MTKMTNSSLTYLLRFSYSVLLTHCLPKPMHKRVGLVILIAVVMVYQYYSESTIYNNAGSVFTSWQFTQGAIMKKLYNMAYNVNISSSLNNQGFNKSHNAHVCDKVKHIFYLKVHKTGSTTFSCMLFRYGLHNGLVFTAFHPHHPYPAADMSAYLLPHPLDIKTGHKFGYKRDIMNRHSVFNHDAINTFMPEDTVFVATLRHPLSQLKSAFNHYNLPERFDMPNTSDPLALFLSNPSKYDKPLPGSLYNPIALDNNITVSFTKSRMAFEFGFDIERAEWDTEYVDNYIEYLGDTFKYFIITEKYDKSLLILREQFCWSYKDILYLPLRKGNYNNKDRIPESYGMLYQNHRNWAKMDYKIYDYFLAKKELEIYNKRGEPFQQEVDYYQKLLLKLTDFCNIICRRIHSKLFRTAIKTSDFKAAREIINETVLFDKTKYHDTFTVNGEECAVMMLHEFYMEETIVGFQYKTEPYILEKKRFHSVFRLDGLLNPANFLFECK